MASEIVLQALRSMAFVRELEPEHLEKLASIATRVTFSAGATIFREGDESELVYLVEEGQVALEIQVPGQGQVTLLMVGPGQLLGWSSLFPPQRKTAGARAVAPTRAIAINAARLRELCRTDQDLGYAILWRVAEVISDRLRAARMQLLDTFAPTSRRPA